MLHFFKNTFTHFLNSNTFQKGASLAYYAVFSLFPMIIIVTSLLGILFGKEAVSGEIYTQLKDVLGSDAAQQIQELIKNQHKQHNSIFTSIIGFVTLVLGASGMFNQIHSSFNSIWGIKAKPKNSIVRYFTKHITSFSILILLFLIILVSTTMTSFLIKYADTLHSDYRFVYVYEHFISFLAVGLVFTLMFKFLSDAKVYWKAALAGGLFTSFLFMIGKIGIGMYIGHSHISSTFGSASVLALIMLWVYYTSQIIYLGASFVKVISDKLNLEIVPGDQAVKIEEREM
ncbi:YihY family inner membrane protein [Flavobacteriaceae bacterium R38]|nr:YihY family inner membrane protein [Flavobacteriaceae bacterium R38]